MVNKTITKIKFQKTMIDITIILTEQETAILIKALYNYNYEGLEQYENTILDRAKSKINDKYTNQTK